MLDDAQLPLKLPSFRLSSENFGPFIQLGRPYCPIWELKKENESPLVLRGTEKLGVRDSAPWFWVIEEVSLLWNGSFPDVCSSFLTQCPFPVLFLHEEHAWTRWGSPAHEHWHESGKPLAKLHCLMFIMLFHWNHRCLILGKTGGDILLR